MSHPASTAEERREERVSAARSSFVSLPRNQLVLVKRANGHSSNGGLKLQQQLYRPPCRLL